MKGCRPLNRVERKEALRNCGSSRERALLSLGCATGYRISELLSLRICDVIDINNNPLRYVSVKASNTKTKEGRTVLLNTVAGKAVADHAKYLLSQGISRTAHLFQGKKSKVNAISRQQAWRLLKDLFEKACIFGQVATHTLRKTFAADCYQLLGGAIEKVARALGHKSLNSTLSYLSFNNTEIDAAIEQLG